MRDLLTIDVGNSTIDCRRSADGARLRLASDSEPTTMLSFCRHPAIRRAVVVSVAPTPLVGVLRLLRDLGLPTRVAGVDLLCPLPIDYETPHTLGADRWVGALAAHSLHGRTVVVDCGSATTVNLVDADGTFRGGAIAPGLRSFVVGMASVTPALPPAGLDAVPVMPPRTTQAAIDTGVLLGWTGLVERLVAAALASSRGPARVVVTGGNAFRLLAHTRLMPMHEPDLVHRGLELLAGTAPWNC